MTRLALLLLLLTVSLGIAACGGDDDASPEPSLRDPSSVTEDELAGEPSQEEKRKRAGEGSATGGDEGADDRGEASSPAEGSGSGGATSNGGASRRGGRSRRGRSGPPTSNAERQRLRRELDAAKAAVRRFWDGLRTKDQSICTEVMTQAYVEALTGKSGAAAVADCRERVSKSKVDSRVGPFGPSEIRNGRAYVTFNLISGDQVKSQSLELAKEDGRWKVDAKRS